MDNLFEAVITSTDIDFLLDEAERLVSEAEAIRKANPLRILAIEQKASEAKGIVYAVKYLLLVGAIEG